MRISLTGIEMVEGCKAKWQAFLRDSGVETVKSGWIESEHDICRDTETFTAYFNSSYWTGQGYDNQ